jgi:hypothetical protein
MSAWSGLVALFRACSGLWICPEQRAPFRAFRASAAPAAKGGRVCVRAGAQAQAHTRVRIRARLLSMEHSEQSEQVKDSKGEISVPSCVPCWSGLNVSAPCQRG